MPLITFFDTEVESTSGKILDAGGIKSDGSRFHSDSSSGLIRFLEGSDYICGHNIIKHDLKFLQKISGADLISNLKPVDTLLWSPLLFPGKPYHSLIKDDKLENSELNNPLNDALNAKRVLNDEISAFKGLNEEMRIIFLGLLWDHPWYMHFFGLIDFNPSFGVKPRLEERIRDHFRERMCTNANLNTFINEHRVELAYALALINSDDKYSITPPWVLMNFPYVESIVFHLRSRPCLKGCGYCNDKLDPGKNLLRIFKYTSFRTYGGEPLQELSVKAAIDNKSLLAVFPTGGGKSLTFQLPALMEGENSRALTVVISPLQSLMKDQVDNLEKILLTDAVTINGLLDPVERAKSIERVENGSASILYISPESLRSKTIERLLLGRKIARFVIDEAHCFSSWGHDFRVDYLYIGDFIKSLQEKKNLPYPIPVSCFTATAKPKVIRDICDYFHDKLSLELELFQSGSSRTNLTYKVIPGETDDDKYISLRRLIDQSDCPTIVYVSRTQKTLDLAKHLCSDGYRAAPYNGKMEVREKTQNQNDFIKGEIRIIVATSAFGMGVDKDNIGMVIHYNISDSLESYVQEAGRAGRREDMTAECYVLYNEDDLTKHFNLLNQTRLNLKEVQQVWQAVKEMTKTRNKASNSALEFARKAGWDENVKQIETRVTTALSALEEAGYLKRTHNSPRVFATGILVRNANDAIEKINASPRFVDKEKGSAIRIIKKLISARSRKQNDDEVPEARIDYISDHLGIAKEEVIGLVNKLTEEKILADSKDLNAFINKGDSAGRSRRILSFFLKLEKYLFEKIDETPGIVNIKELNGEALLEGCLDVNPARINTIFNFWSIKNWVIRETKDIDRNHIQIYFKQPVDLLRSKLEKRQLLSVFILDFLYKRSEESEEIPGKMGEFPVEFSTSEIRDQYQQTSHLFKIEIETGDIEDALLFLSRTGAISIEGGFMVIYNRLNIERIEKSNKVQYKKEDYKNLDEFYKNKTQQIHIVGAYAQKVIEDYNGALRFVDDYFKLNYSSFLNKYFPGKERDELNRTITPAKFRQIFGTLSTSQVEIIHNNVSKHIVVAAGPGSGKTRILVHKLASLLMTEDVKTEQLLMLTFSRAAATEFKLRLKELIGSAANYVEIKTFHSYCFDLLGQVGNIERSESVIPETVEMIRKGEVEPSRIAKSVLVIDEAQDMDENNFRLVESLMEKNEEMRVIAVGDDDQNIYEFRHADSGYLEKFIQDFHARKYELIENFRSRKNLVDFTNQFVTGISHRLKNMQIEAVMKENGWIYITGYVSKNLVVPLVEKICGTDLSGTTCVLTATNEEASLIAGLLKYHGQPARLIQTSEGFSLIHLVELYDFIAGLEAMNTGARISDETWNTAKRQLEARLSASWHKENCLNLLNKFELLYPSDRYISDIKVFISESKFEDFIEYDNEIIIVSTIHKAKGKEFDNVFLLLNDFNFSSDDKKRQVYVALTRARKNIFVAHNGRYMEQFATEQMSATSDTKTYLPPGHLTRQLGHKDVVLGYFRYVAHRVNRITNGQALSIKEDGLANEDGELVLKFSKLFRDDLIKIEEDGYKFKSAIVNFLVYWKEKESQEYIKIILPEVVFERKTLENNEY